MLITFDSSTYTLRWDRKIAPAAIEAASRYSYHVNGHLIRVSVAVQLGDDLTTRFRNVASH